MLSERAYNVAHRRGDVDVRMGIQHMSYTLLDNLKGCTLLCYDVIHARRISPRRTRRRTRRHSCFAFDTSIVCIFMQSSEGRIQTVTRSIGAGILVGLEHTMRVITQRGNNMIIDCPNGCR